MVSGQETRRCCSAVALLIAVLCYEPERASEGKREIQRKRETERAFSHGVLNKNGIVGPNLKKIARSTINFGINWVD